MAAGVMAEARVRATLLRTATELRDACETAEGRIAVAEHAIPTLIGLLRDPEAADHAAAAVELITVRNRRVRNQLVKLAVIDAGGIPPLVALLSVASATSGTVERAACTLCEMSSDGNVHEAICRAGGVPSLVALLSSSEASEVTQIGALRTLSRIAESSADAVYKAGAIAPAVALLSRAVDRRRSIRPSTSNRFMRRFYYGARRDCACAPSLGKHDHLGSISSLTPLFSRRTGAVWSRAGRRQTRNRSVWCMSIGLSPVEKESCTCQCSV